MVGIVSFEKETRERSCPAIIECRPLDPLMNSFCMTWSCILVPCPIQSFNGRLEGLDTTLTALRMSRACRKVLKMTSADGNQDGILDILALFRLAGGTTALNECPWFCWGGRHWMNCSTNF
eukprot:578668-Pelagomonas_calceolata.AAC.4